jgi:very-short-patch-repair endonuclease
MVRDRRRDLTLRGAGYIVLRYTWDQLVEEPALVMADLTRVLASR